MMMMMKQGTNKSPFLLSYKHKINPTLYPSPLCPLCKNYEHNTSHLFNFTHIPTKLTPLDLCNAPCQVTELLEAREEKVAAHSGREGITTYATSDHLHIEIN